MKKKITESQLRSIVEQKINEAWYNNIDDFYHGVGKAATIGALGAGSLMGGAYCLDKGLESQERYEQYINQEAAKNSFGTELSGKKAFYAARERKRFLLFRRKTSMALQRPRLWTIWADG